MYENALQSDLHDLIQSYLTEGKYEKMEKTRTQWCPSH